MHAVGSAFLHQSYTYVGSRYDNLMIAVLSYLGHQMMVENLPNKSPMLVELQPSKRSMSSHQIVTNLTETIRTQPVAIWGKVMDLGDFPHDYFTNFGAMACNFVALLLPSFLTFHIIDLIAKVILP